MLGVCYYLGMASKNTAPDDTDTGDPDDPTNQGEPDVEITVSETESAHETHHNPAPTAPPKEDVETQWL